MTPIPRIQIYSHCPRCGSDLFEIRGTQLTACSACGLMLYHNPCGAAGAILVDSVGRVLLIRRAHEPARGKLAFPGGFVDNGESAEQALRRELIEEIGIDVTDFTYVCSHPNNYEFGGIIYPTLDVFFVARVPEFGAARALHEIAELVVLNAGDVDPDELAFPSTRAAWNRYRNSAGPD